ncbi:MAG: C4-dicarboxylate ABC transporter permease [Cyclobacteriaceae bacterium]|nr:MAG: C4-dicarboxylate ABC transporter permease [Cyclobacteriaceae bacterium]
MRERLIKWLEWLLAFLMAVLVVDVMWQVITRFILNSPSSFTDELARFLLIWLGLLGAALVSGHKMHLAIDLVSGRLIGTKSQNRLAIFIESVVAVATLAIMVYGGSILVYTIWSLGQTSTALQVPLSVVYSIIPLSGLLITYFAVEDILSRTRKTKVNGY